MKRPARNIAARSAAVAASVLALALAGGCGGQPGHQGYVVDPVLVGAVQPGVDNMDSVQTTLGRPTFVGQFDRRDWYYVSRDTRRLAFANPRPTAQTILHVRFDEAGNVVAVERSGLEHVVRLSPEGDETPTLGRDRSFFEELFGNIGRVGAPGTGGSAGDPNRP